MTDRLIVDGIRRPIYEDAYGQHLLDDGGERVHGKRARSHHQPNDALRASVAKTQEKGAETGKPGKKMARSKGKEPAARKRKSS